MSSQQGLLVVSATVGIALAVPLFHGGTRRALEALMSRAKYAILQAEEAQAADDAPAVSEIFIYPVKSLKAVSLPTAEIDSLGLKGDRRFMLVCPVPPPLAGFLDLDPTHRFITQRQFPTLATVSAALLEGALKLSSKEGASVEVDIVAPSKAPKKEQVRYRARIWDDVVEVLDMGDAAAAFFQKIVGDAPELEGIRLTQIASDRTADDSYIPPQARTWLGLPPLTSLTDEFPVLIAFEASLEELNRRLQEKKKPPILMSRFRPNIVIRGTKPFEEDNWKTIKIGPTTFHLVKGCPRCKQSCTDQATGEVSEEPVSTLGEFRALSENPQDVYFAQNAVAQGKSVSVGAKVQIVKRGNPVWVKPAST